MRISDWSSDVCSSDLLMSGLGYVFSPEANHRPLLRTIVRRLYRTGVRRAKAIFVFNSDDRPEMIRQGIISHDHHVFQVPGSGVDIEHFRHQPMCEGPLHFLMIARLIQRRSEEHTSELQSLMRISYAVFCLKKKSDT